PLHHHPGEAFRSAAGPGAREKLVKGNITLQGGRPARRALRLREGTHAAQAAALEMPLLARRIDRCDARLGEEGTGRRRLAVDELGAELDRDVEAGHAARPAAPADALARLEHEHRAIRTRDRAR